MLTHFCSRSFIAVMLMSVLSACGGGGGGAAAPPAPPPPPSPPAPAPGPTNPATALARPISNLLLCGNGLAKRASSISSDQFAALNAGITHSHAVDEGIWTQASGSIETVMRTGAVVAANIDGDCWSDLIFTTGATASGQILLYENAGGGGYSQRLLNLTPSLNPVAGIGVADLDGDYRLDLALGNLLAGDMQTYRANGIGGFELLQSISMPRSTFGFAFADYSGDQWLDVYAAHWDIVPPAADAPALLRNRGDDSSVPDGLLIAGDSEAGTGSSVVPHDFNLAPAFVDLDHDLDLDLLIASDFGSSQVLINGGALDYSVAIDSADLPDENAAGQAVRDFDNDGFWDWFVASVRAPTDGRSWPWGTAGNQLYWGEDQFPYLTTANPDSGVEDAGWPWGVCAEDFNNDGLTDLFVENGFGFAPADVMSSQSGDPFIQQINDSLLDQRYSRARLFLNQGGRSFIDESVSWGITGLTNGRGVACYDYDRDGDIDIAVAQNSGPALLYENRQSAQDGANFLSIRLISIAPNVFAVGAVVTLESGGVTQLRRIGANDSFQGQHGYDLHFGLDATMTVSQISVRWPDGTTEIYSDIPANRFLTLLNPRMLAYPDAVREARIESAIVAALTYVSQPSQLGNDLLLGLTWMERLHDITLSYSPGDELIARTALAEGQGRVAEARQLRSWRRLFDPGYQISVSDHSQLAGFDAVTFAGVYCHQFPLQDTDIQALSDYAMQGDYFTTHALLALLWAIDNNCPMPPTWNPELLADIVGDVYGIADAGGSPEVTDLRVEAMAMLAAIGRHDLIQARWVDQLLAAQMAGGGFKAAPDDLEPADHTTGLALWLVLQLADSNKVHSGYVAQTWGP